ncbi:MAG: flagellar biosynthesis protein FlgN [Spirochaetales bacterium]
MSITNDEREERIAILRRFKATVERQRARFAEYLRVLEAGSDNETAEERLAFHIELEQQILAEIETFEQVAGPLEALYRAKDPTGAERIPKLRAALERTKLEVLARVTANQTLLRVQIAAIREQISALRA